MELHSPHCFPPPLASIQSIYAIQPELQWQQNGRSLAAANHVLVVLLS